jgi:hypothetical protein
LRAVTVSSLCPNCCCCPPCRPVLLSLRTHARKY